MNRSLPPVIWTVSISSSSVTVTTRYLRRRTASLAGRVPRRPDGFGRIFYRRRRRRVKRKSGNLDDFCRRWGGDIQVHGGARRRQRDERRMPDQPGAPDGSHTGRRVSSRPRHGRRAWTRCMRACSSSPRASTAHCLPPVCTSGSWANPTTGATTRSSA
jgi:hypothetical protein